MKDIMKTYNLGIVILMEAKINSSRGEIIIQNLKMPKYVEIPL